MGEITRAKLPRFHFNSELCNFQLARSCMCYISICLSRISGSLDPNNTSGNISISTPWRNQLRTLPLFNYVFCVALVHLRHLGPYMKSILHDVKVLAGEIQQYSGTWDEMFAEETQQHSKTWDKVLAPRPPGPSVRAPGWPAARHDLLLYILIAFAPNSLLQAVLRHTALRPKEGTNPLNYAAYFNKDEHAHTLLSRGAKLSTRGWGPYESSQTLPIEIAIRAEHYALVALFVTEGSPVPSHIFKDRLSYLWHTPSSVVRMMLQTDDLVEAAIGAFDILENLSLDVTLMDVGEQDLIAVIRRLIQLDPTPFQVFRASRPFPGLKLLATTINALNELSMVRFLLKYDANVHDRTAAGDSMLHIALESFCKDEHYLEAEKLLVDHGGDSRRVGSSRKMPLDIAIRDYPSTVRYLLSVGVTPSSDWLFVALKMHTQQGRAPMTRLLLEQGADVHGCTAAGDSVLHIALESFSKDSDCFEVVKLLIDRGCDPQRASSSGRTPLHITIEHDYLCTAEYLLSHGATPSSHLLFVALAAHNRRGRAPMIHLLLRHGANPEACTETGDSLLHVALELLSEDNDRLEVVKLLVGRACDLQRANSSGKTPLCIAVARGLVHVTRYLLSLGVPSSPDLLFVALCSQHQHKIAPMIICLLENGADVHACTTAGESIATDYRRSTLFRDRSNPGWSRL